MNKKLLMLFLLMLPGAIFATGRAESVLGKRKAEASPVGAPSAQRPISSFSEDSIDSYAQEELALAVSVEDMDAFQQELSRDASEWSFSQSLSLPFLNEQSEDTTLSHEIWSLSAGDQTSNITELSYLSTHEQSELDLDDLSALAQAIHEEESDTQYSASSDSGHQNLGQIKPVQHDCCFCPECFMVVPKDLSNLSKLSHLPECTLNGAGLNNEQILILNQPEFKDHVFGIYYLCPARGLFYLENSKSLNLFNIRVQVDNSFSYHDGIITRLWDKFGFELDLSTHRRKNEQLEEKRKYQKAFDIKSVFPGIEEKTEFACPTCSILFVKENYKQYIAHAKRCGIAKPYICRYKDCDVSYKELSSLIVHEDKHSGVEFCCPDCAYSAARKDRLLTTHIKKQHRDLYDKITSKENNYATSSSSIASCQEELSQSSYSTTEWSNSEFASLASSLNINNQEDILAHADEHEMEQLIGLDTLAQELLEEEEELTQAVLLEDEIDIYERGLRKKTKFYCPYYDNCGEVYTLDQVKQLRKHITSFHKDSYAHLCAYEGCKKRCNSPLSLIDHEDAKHLGKKKYFCPVCLANFSSAKISRNHHCPSGDGLSRDCIIRIESPQFIKHNSGMIYYLNPLSSTKKTSTIKTSAICLRGSDSLEETKFGRNADKSFYYDDGSIFRSWNALGFCDDDSVLGDQEVQASEFKSVRIKPEDERKSHFVCSCCEINFRKDYDGFVEHLKQKGQKKPYVCHYVCEFSSNRKENLHKHEISHSGIEYICPYCDYHIYNPLTLKHYHIKQHHPEKWHHHS